MQTKYLATRHTNQLHVHFQHCRSHRLGHHIRSHELSPHIHQSHHPLLHPIANEMPLGSNVLGPPMEDWVLSQRLGILTLSQQIDALDLDTTIHPIHLTPPLPEVARLLSCKGQPHALSLA